MLTLRYSKSKDNMSEEYLPLLDVMCLFTEIKGKITFDSCLNV